MTKRRKKQALSDFERRSKAAKAGWAKRKRKFAKDPKARVLESYRRAEAARKAAKTRALNRAVAEGKPTPGILIRPSKQDKYRISLQLSKIRTEAERFTKLFEKVAEAGRKLATAPSDRWRRYWKGKFDYLSDYARREHEQFVRRTFAREQAVKGEVVRDAIETDREAFERAIHDELAQYRGSTGSGLKDHIESMFEDFVEWGIDQDYDEGDLFDIYHEG